MLVSTSITTSFPQRVFGFRGAQLLTLQVQRSNINSATSPLTRTRLTLGRPQPAACNYLYYFGLCLVLVEYIMGPKTLF